MQTWWTHESVIRINSENNIAEHFNLPNHSPISYTIKVVGQEEDKTEDSDWKNHGYIYSTLSNLMASMSNYKTAQNIQQGVHKKLQNLYCPQIKLWPTYKK